MSQAVGFLSSTLGKKILMAVTGIILFGFVVGHMLGNLQIYLGEERLNHYAELLQANKPFLWTFRSVMLFLMLFGSIFSTLLAWAAAGQENEIGRAVV